MLAPVYLQIVDAGRHREETVLRAGAGFHIRLELGEGVTKCAVNELQFKVDQMMKSSPRYATCTTGEVLDPFGRQVDEVVAFGKYVITGSMRTGFVKKDQKFGNRLHGYNGGSPRPGMPWAHDE